MSDAPNSELKYEVHRIWETIAEWWDDMPEIPPVLAKMFFA
jgi:hypothetical protein